MQERLSHAPVQDSGTSKTHLLKSKDLQAGFVIIMLHMKYSPTSRPQPEKWKISDNRIHLPPTGSDDLLPVSETPPDAVFYV